MTRAAIYARISLDRDGEGLGVTRQEADCRAHCHAKGWDVAEVYVDNDIGAWSGKRRPAYRRMLDDMKAGAVDAVVVYHLDRLTRRPVELEEFFEVADAAGIRNLACVTGDVDLSTHDGQFLARILGAVARKESDDKSRRTRRKHLELAERGVAVGGGRPFGYDDDKVTIRPDEAALVRDAAGRVLAGATVRGVVQDWNRRGITTPRGNRWSQTALRRVLTSWRAAGIRALGDTPTTYDAWPALLDADTHARLRALLLAPGRTRGGYGPRTHVLTGLLYCAKCGPGNCGRRLIARPQSNRRRTYVCTSNPDTGGCGGIRIVADDLEQWVSELVFARVDGPDFAAAVTQFLDRPTVDDPIPEIHACEQKLAELADDWAHDRVTRAEWLAARRGVEDRLATARRQLARRTALSGTLQPGTGAQLRDLWHRQGDDAMSIDEKHAHLTTLIERVDIAGAVPGWNRFDHRRVTITWRA